MNFILIKIITVILLGYTSVLLASEDLENQDTIISWPSDSTDEQLSQPSESNQEEISKSPEQPNVLKTRAVKTNFRKHDPYYGKDLCGNGEYTCIAVKKNDSWKSLFPDKYQRDLVQRINRTNQGLWGRNWILVPNDINKDYIDYAPFPKNRDTNNQKTVLIDLSKLAFGAYDEDGELVYWGPVNPGKAASKTVRGDNFKVIRKGGADCWSKKFEARIPYCIFFHNGFAMHGFTMPGYPASHGCVRMNNDDALWLNRVFTDYHTRVIVQD